MAVNEHETYQQEFPGSPAQQHLAKRQQTNKSQDAKNFGKKVGGGTVAVPTFSTRNDIGPVGANSLAAKSNTTKLRLAEETKYDTPQGNNKKGGGRKKRRTRRRKRRRKKRKTRRRKRKRRTRIRRTRRRTRRKK